MPSSDNAPAYRIYRLSRSGGFIRDRIEISLLEVGGDDRLAVGDDLACDRVLPAWIRLTALVMMIGLPVTLLIMLGLSRMGIRSNAAAWAFGSFLLFSFAFAAIAALFPSRVYRFSRYDDADHATPPIATLRQVAMGHRKYVLRNSDRDRVARFRRTPAAGHLRIDNIASSVGVGIPTDTRVRVRISRKRSALATMVSSFGVGAMLANAFHPPWNSVGFFARSHNGRWGGREQLPIAQAERFGRARDMELMINMSKIPPAEAPADIVLLAAACLLLSLEGDRHDV